jgi:hypothetical protein
VLEEISHRSANGSPIETNVAAISVLILRTNILVLRSIEGIEIGIKLGEEGASLEFMLRMNCSQVSK